MVLLLFDTGNNQSRVKKMAYFAQLDNNNVVVKVISVDDKVIINPWTGDEEEILGRAHCKLCYGRGDYKQTFKDGSSRIRYAVVGGTYSEELDAFILPKQYESWALDEVTKNWVSPLGENPDLTEEQLQLGQYYRWDETAYQADNTTGWVLYTLE